MALLLWTASPVWAGDGFAAHLHLPQNISLSEPQPELEPMPGQNPMQRELLQALKAPAQDLDPHVQAVLPNLSKVQSKAPDVLLRYLEASPAWRVFEDRGQLFATRRWQSGQQWGYGLNGYVSSFGLDPFGEQGLPPFQFRLTLGLGPQPWVRSPRATPISLNQAAEPKLFKENHLLESLCQIEGPNFVLEVFEQSALPERRLTQAALTALERELQPLAAQAADTPVSALLPAGMTQRGQARLDLYQGLQPGLYQARIWANPGAPGRVFLKAYEITQGTPLSAKRLATASSERMGWSADPQALFLADSPITIYEGDWGQPYAARFELWFQPDRGGPARKLLERNFKIEGWQA